mmetsp:Transcript_24089/g.78534  ORF Transcript_24089/g.78534 Transcript_24089/m.78534 type:complete len:219 (-) Transcript_24089:212-868(-)
MMGLLETAATHGLVRFESLYAFTYTQHQQNRERSVVGAPTRRSETDRTPGRERGASCEAASPPPRRAATAREPHTRRTMSHTLSCGVRFGARPMQIARQYGFASGPAELGPGPPLVPGPRLSPWEATHGDALAPRASRRRGGAGLTRPSSAACAARPAGCRLAGPPPAPRHASRAPLRGALSRALRAVPPRNTLPRLPAARGPRTHTGRRLSSYVLAR